MHMVVLQVLEWQPLAIQNFWFSWTFRITPSSCKERIYCVDRMLDFPLIWKFHWMLNIFLFKIQAANTHSQSQKKFCLQNEVTWPLNFNMYKHGLQNAYSYSSMVIYRRYESYIWHMTFYVPSLPCPKGL